ncbi:MAG: hypothetical protein JWP76_3686, partial [Dactylosporangium sp.]|nr:hypothetical protein [Dactylosporangium sp.]
MTAYRPSAGYPVTTTMPPVGVAHRDHQLDDDVVTHEVQPGVRPSGASWDRRGGPPAPPSSHT